MTSLLDTRRPRLLLTLLCLLLWMPGFFSIPPGDRDESRFAQGTKQMLETHDFVRIMNGTEARNRKPIGIYWLQVPFVAAADGLGLATENPIWPYRVPSALGGLMAVLAAYGLGRRVLDRRAALLGAGMLAASMAVVVEVHIAKTDAALLGATTVAMALLGRAYLVPGQFGRGAAAGFWLAMGAGVLLKGPITPMVAALAVVTLLVVDRRAEWLRGLRAGWGVPLMLLVVVPWFVAIGVATHGAFFADAVGGDLGRKLTSGDDAHWGPPGLHLVLLPVLLFPAVVALPAGVAAAWRGRRTPAMRFLLAWIVPSWLVFEAAPTKLPHYTLPLYPAICLVVAHGVVSGVRLGGWRWAGPVLACVVAAALAVGGVAAPIYLGVDPMLGVPALVAALFVGWRAVRATDAPGVAGTVLSAVLLYAAVLGWELPGLWPLWIAPRVVASVPGVLAGQRLGSVGFAEPSLMFLAGTGTQFLLPDEGVAALAEGRVDVLLVGDRDLAAVQVGLAARGIAPRLVGVVPGFNYSRGRRVTLTALAR
jgi:4-amino-4-deoxy-L-arabinose transferase-like glycosyltransferase